jgi:leishmanolysin-like peptidase
MNTTANPYVYAQEMTRLIQVTAADPDRKPLFVFLALHNVHQPVESPQEFVDLYPESDYNSSNYARRYNNDNTSWASNV